jgi:hypothetical protein
MYFYYKLLQRAYDMTDSNHIYEAFKKLLPGNINLIMLQYYY